MRGFLSWMGLWGVMLFLGMAGAGCQTPLLTPEVEEALRHVYVANIPERSGQVLRQSLAYAFQSTHGSRAYTLTIKLEEGVHGLALSAEGRSQLNHLTLRASYTLVCDKDQKILDKGFMTAGNTYNILPAIQQSPSLYYSITVAETYARQNAVHQLVSQFKVVTARVLAEHLQRQKTLTVERPQKLS